MITLKTHHRTPSLAELKVSYRRGGTRGPEGEAVVLSCPRKCEAFVRCIWNPDTLELREEFVAIYLNPAFEVLGWVRVATGAIDEVTPDVRIVLGVALKTASTDVLVAHNHPSGPVIPSDADRHFTRRFQEAARTVCVRLVDHVIVSRTSFFSMSGAGMM